MSNKINNKTELSSINIPKPKDIEGLKENSDLKKHIFPKFQDNILKEMRQQKIKFSFHFLDVTDPLFNCAKTDNNWFLHLFDNLQKICDLNRNQLVTNYRQHYDAHELKWFKSNYSKKKFDKVPDQILSEIDSSDQLQFRLSSSGGRIHGFFILNTFYIVWLDPHHHLDPDSRYGGIKYYDAQLTPFQVLEIDHERLKEEFSLLSKDNEELLEELYSIEDSYKACKKND